MARTKPEKKTPARNFILEPKVKSKGRGKNKVEVVEGVTKTRLQSRLYCVPVFQGPIRKVKKNAKFECFTDIEAAQKAMGMPSTPLPAVPSKGRKRSSAAQEYVTELRKLLAEMQAASPGPTRAEYPVLPLPPMKGLRGTPAEHTKAMLDYYGAFDDGEYDGDNEAIALLSKAQAEARWAEPSEAAWMRETLEDDLGAFGFEGLHARRRR